VVVEGFLKRVGGVVCKLVLAADFPLQEVRQKLVKDVEIGEIGLRALFFSDFEDVVAEEVRLDAPILTETHDGLLDEVLVPAEHRNIGGVVEGEVIEVENGLLIGLNWPAHVVLIYGTVIGNIPFR
jgi:hypothetical protein